MNFNAQLLNDARNEGYSEKEIWDYISSKDKRFSEAQQEGYSLDDVAGYFTKPEPVAAPQQERGALQATAEELEAGIGRAAGAFTQAAVGSVRMLTDVFGANNPVSKKIAGVEDYLDQFVTAQARQDQKEISRLFEEAEGKGLGAKVMAGLEAVAVSPETLGPQVAGYMLPSLAAGVLTAGATLPVTIGAQATVGGLQAAGTIKGEIYKSVRDYSREQGLTEEQADKAASEAQAYGGKNLDQILIGAGIGALAASTGVERIATRILSGQGKEVTKKSIREFIKTGFKAGAVEGVVEGVQEGQEQMAQNIALQREGADVPTMRMVPQAATMGAAAGALMGGAAGGIEYVSAEQKELNDIEKTADRESRSLSAPDAATQSAVNILNQTENSVDSLREELDTLEPTDPRAQSLRMQISEEQKKAEALKVAIGEKREETVQQVQSRIEKSKVELVGLEPTSRKAKALEAQIAQDEAKVTALSEPITTVEAEQARLAREIAAPVEEAAPVEPTPVAEAPVVEPVTPPVEPVAEVTPTEEAEFAELMNLMERKGKAENKVSGVKFSKKDEARYNELLPKYRSRLRETITPETDPVVWKDIEGNDIKVSQKGTFYTVENGRVRTGPAFQSEGFIKDVSPQPVSAAVVESNNVPLPEGYTKQGDVYVYQAPVAETPAVAPAPEVAPSPAVAETEGLVTKTASLPKETPSTTIVKPTISETQSIPQQDVKSSRYGKFLGDSAPQAISEAKSALVKFKASNAGKLGDNPFQAEPRLRELKNAISLFVANRLSITNQKADEIAEQIILGKPNIVDKVTELKPIKAKELDDIGAIRSAITRFGYELGDKKTYRHPREGEATAPTPTAPAVGNRIKLGKSPQTYTIEEVIPQTEAEKELGEQYYNVKNEKTGEVQTVEAKDLKPIKKMPIRKAISDPIPTPPERRVNFDDIIDTVQDMFGKDFVAGRLYVMDDVNEKAKAGYDPEDGRIYLNEAYMDTDDSIRDLIAHELGHYITGDPTMRPKFQEFLASLPKNERARLERFVDRVYNDQTGEIRLEEKEVRAFIMRLNAGDNRNIFQKMLDALKKWLNEKLGTKFKMTDRDALAILSGAIARFKAGEFIERKEDGTRYARVERSEDVQEDIARAEKIQSVVNDTISKMPQDQGRDYNAYVNEGKSEAQIAEDNKTSINQVRTNILRGRKEVSEAIKKAKIDTKAKPKNAVLEWTTGAVKKYLTKEGNLPGATFQKWVKRNAKLAREAEEARQATQDFYEGLRKIYKINKLRFIWEGLSSIPPEDVAKFNDALAGEIPITDLPAEIQDPLTRMRQHIDAMSAELIATGQLPEYLEAKAMNNLGVYLTRSYKIFSDPDWIKKIPQEKLIAARNFLYQQQSKTDPNFTIEDADRKLEQMLNDWAGERGMEGKRGGRLGAKDLSVMMTRSEIPKQLRDVMGENTNVIFNYANTIAKISRFVADQRFLEAVKQEGAGEFLFTKDAAPAGFNTLIAPEESRTMAPLSGLRTTPEIAKAFEEFGKAYDATANPALRLFGWLNAVGKANLTVGSLFTQARNMIGQPFFFLANGHSDISVINKEVNKIMKDKGMSKEQARNELIKMAAGEALVNENAYAGELKDAFEQLGLKTFEDMDADEFSRQFALTRLFKKGTQGAQKVYQKTDELGKLIGWLNETKRVQSMNPGMSRQEAMSVAAERTRNTYPTYSNSSEAMRLFRRQPFFGPFATFFYETFRTTYWNVKYAFEDINSGTEAGKKAGIARLSGTMAQISIGAFAVNAISAMMAGIGDQEEEDVRRMLPPWAQNASLVWFQKNKDGVYNFINFSSLNPYNALSDPFVTMMSGFSRGEDPTEIFVNSASTFLTPFTSEQPVTAAAIDAARNVTERGTKVYNEQDDLTTKTSKILLHIFGKAFTPGTIDRLRKRIIPAVKGETVSSRAPEPYKEIAAEFTGVRFENLDMRQAFQNKAWEFNKAQNDSERIFRDVATRRRIVTEEEQIDAYRRAEQSRYQNWQDMYRNYMALRRAGASKSEAVRLMTDIKISQREASYIARGKYVPYEVSDEVRRRSKLNGNTVPLKEIKAIAKEMPRVLEDVK